MSCGMHLEGRGGGGLCFYGMKRLREPERVRGSLRGCPQTLAWTPHSLVGPPAMEFRSKQALSLGKRTVCPRASWSSLSPTSFPPSPHSPSTLTAVILFIEIPDRETPKAKYVKQVHLPALQTVVGPRCRWLTHTAYAVQERTLLSSCCAQELVVF